MKCSRPFMQGMAEFGCGQCMPCRILRRRLWTARLMLEAQKHKHSCFVTLTYKPEEYPKDGSVSVREMQLWLKRLRKLSGGRLIRYYVVGEYGDKSGRAHYHAVLFGVSAEELQLLQSSWTKGLIHVGNVTPESASYVVSYVCKRMTKADDERLGGRHPEFARMSTHPGIGAPAIEDFAKPIREGIDIDTGEFYGLPNGDVPSCFRFNGRRWPIGRYLRRLLRRSLGLPEGEPVAVGELRNYRRYIDLSAHGKRGWKVREDSRQQMEFKAKKHMEISLSKKGIGI